MNVPPAWPTVNAALNAAAAVCLVAGLVAVKRGNVPRHRACMLAALTCSGVFLASYLTYHAVAGSVRYPADVAGRTGYLILLVSHTVLAVPVAVLAPLTGWLGLTDRIGTHRRLAKVTLPLWLYVSVTGVAVWAWLYLVAGARAA